MPQTAHLLEIDSWCVIVVGHGAGKGQQIQDEPWRALPSVLHRLSSGSDQAIALIGHRVAG